MRCLVKNIGMHGLGLYIYAGEDLPEEEPVTDDKYKDMINDITNKKITELGSNTKFYESVQLTEERFKDGYKNNPKTLYEWISKF